MYVSRCEQQSVRLDDNSRHAGGLHIGHCEFKKSKSTNAMVADRQRAQRLTERRANGVKARQTISVPASAVLTGLHPMVAAQLHASSTIHQHQGPCPASHEEEQRRASTGGLTQHQNEHQMQISSSTPCPKEFLADGPKRSWSARLYPQSNTRALKATV